MTTRVAVVGASGYTGAELIRLILGHPHLELTHLSAGRSAGRRVADVFPHLEGRLDLAIADADADAIAAAATMVFLALPHGESAVLADALRERGRKVVDLSADFRLDSLEDYQRWYGEHGAPRRIEEAVYGLPERYRSDIARASLIACPGCYPTSAILAAAPLLEAGIVKPTGVVVDSKSGVSGAGRTPKLGAHFPEMGEGVRAYAVAGRHRHTAEIIQELARAADADVTLMFSPHLIPMSRGIFTCVYLDPVDPGHSEDYFRWALAKAYENEPFVTVLDGEALPDTSHVRGSNHAHLAVRRDESTGKILALAAIDNLVKGAAGQAVQCANLMLGVDETAGLEQVPLFP